MVVLSRLLLPAEIGTYVVGFSIAALVQSLRDFGTSSYLVKSEPTQAAIRGAFGVAMVTSATAAVALLIASHALARFYGNSDLTGVLVVCAVLALLQPIGLPAQAILRRKLDFKTLCIVNTAANSIGLVATIGFAIGGASYLAAPLGALATALATISLLGIREPKLVFIRPSFQDWRSITGFGGYATGASLLVDFGISAPNFIVGKLLGFSDVGVYSRARAIVKPVTSLLIRPFMPAVLPSFAKAHRNGEDIKGLYLRLTSLYLAVAWPAFGLACISMPDLVHVVLGPKWSGAVPIAQLLCIGYMVWAPTALSSDLFTATDHVRIAFRREIAIQPARVLLVYVAAHHSLLLVATSQILVHLYSILVTQWLLVRSVGIGWRDLAGAAFPSAAVALASVSLPAVLTFSRALDNTHPLFGLLVIAILGGVSWLSSVFLFGHPAAKAIGAILRSTPRLAPPWRSETRRP